MVVQRVVRARLALVRVLRARERMRAAVLVAARITQELAERLVRALQMAEQTQAEQALVAYLKTQVVLVLKWLRGQKLPPELVRLRALVQVLAPRVR